jgi:hypothetical protein
LISPTRFIALRVVVTNSRSYRTGTFLRFSKSIVESCEFLQVIYGRRQETTHDGHFLARCFPESLRPSHFSRVPLHSASMHENNV